MEKRFVKFCPRCKSTNVSQVKDNPLMGAYGLPSAYECTNCSYRANVFPEVKESNIGNVKDGSKFSEGMKSESSVDIAYGKFTSKVLWKMFGPLSSILGVVLLFSPVNKIIGSLFLIAGVIMSVIAYKKVKND